MVRYTHAFSWAFISDSLPLKVHPVSWNEQGTIRLEANPSNARLRPSSPLHRQVGQVSFTRTTQSPQMRCPCRHCESVLCVCVGLNTCTRVVCLRGILDAAYDRFVLPYVTFHLVDVSSHPVQADWAFKHTLNCTHHFLCFALARSCFGIIHFL